VVALLGAFPKAARRKRGSDGKRALDLALEQKCSMGVVHALFRAYPRAVDRHLDLSKIGPADDTSAAATEHQRLLGDILRRCPRLRELSIR
jgi:hypothetical protein